MVQKSDVQWEFLVYTQMWPQTSCIEINETQQSHKCKMPSNVKTWTVHGLWPSIRGGKGPFYCNDSWPFRPDEIKDIQPDLEMYWPNLVMGESVSSFWKHEWVKHGTCAASLPSLNSEHNYFAVGLQLQKTFNLTRIFGAAGIHPSLNDTHKLQDIRNALGRSIGGHFSRILCMEAKTKTTQLLAQIEICIDKDFKTIDCDKTKIHTKYQRGYRTEWDPYPYFPQFEDCQEDVPILYFPIIANSV